jgi:hypothetical protein
VRLLGGVLMSGHHGRRKLRIEVMDSANVLRSCFVRRGVACTAVRAVWELMAIGRADK